MSDVVDWADTIVERNPIQSSTLLDLTLAGRMPLLDVIRSLRDLSEGIDVDAAAKGVIGRLHRAIVGDTRSLHDGVAVLKALRWQGSVSQALDDAIDDAIHSYELAAEDVFGDYDVERTRFESWIAGFAADERSIWNL